MAVDYYEQKGKYRITWAGPKGARVYTAWFETKWHAFNHAPIGYFREGSDDEKHQAAKQCCSDHWQLRQAG